MTKNSKTFEKPESNLCEEIASEFNISQQTVRNYVSLLDLLKEPQNLFKINN